MWIYNEPTTPPTHMVDASSPLDANMLTAENFKTSQIHLFYRQSGYSGIYTLARSDQSSSYWINIQLPATVYDAIIDLQSRKVTSLRDRRGEWLLAPENVGRIKYKKNNESVWQSIGFAVSRTYYREGINPIMVMSGHGTGGSYQVKTASVQIKYQSEEGDMDIVTGYIGEPHITAVQDRDTNRGIIGEESYILDVGDKLAAEVVSATEIRIRDGSLCHQGCIGNITNGAYDALTISNGSQGMLRHDLIVARYQKNADTHAESLTLVVIEGTPAASSPADPAYNEGDIRDGDSPVDMPLYRVNINGVNISSITRLAPIAYPLDAPGEGTFSKIETVTFNAQTTLHRAGNMVIFNIDASTSAVIPAGSSGNGFIVFPVGFRPPSAKFFSGRVASGVIGEYFLSSNGQLQVNPQLAAGTTFRLSGSFIV